MDFLFKHFSKVWVTVMVLGLALGIAVLAGLGYAVNRGLDIAEQSSTCQCD